MNRHRGLKRSPFRTRPRNTGPSEEVKALVMARDGWRCVRCRPDENTGSIDVHHRVNRGMGGSSDPATNRLSNLLAMCRGCNWELESNTNEGDYDNGWKVRHGARPPSEVAVLYASDRRRYVLDDEGGRILLSH